ncbi:Ribosome biogenesis protein BRX1 homolog [Caenorhabditis elegans]|uniref:Ribosome biogenesis protein BRX1 homolog n=1 Tax=Caenorhabditis elegans TaxID=6239 RepID=BRX1_CAEEL|nr:Ribosome biogenesis protein BRX1 homolog [Caenorhabditis elegans]P34524.1 RecName: Full=Ribosome biogenesis protein BRX1 homolog; AltName: Full=Brix domain-containing protein 2 homolog [Caenorhabditis elegans]CCD71195.1 Ribosome biogenesis protein BRX1 homolog [Caenorhabditis elegans]|eukprot:NP_498756.1 Ribosome biogenesis protein BRX1 homolog [Caenorhabditis elegans]
MGKFSKIKKVQEEESAHQKMEWEAAGAKDSSSDDSSDESDNDDQPKQATEETRKRAELWTNRERVLVLCSRGADVRTRYLMKDIKDLLPHAKGDSKLDQQKSLNVLNEIAEMKNCTKVMYFESRKRKDTYLWMSNVEKGPSIKFLVHNVHTMKELKMSGNCLRASRPVLSFDDAFDKKPQLKLIKAVLMQTLGTPHHHPRSQPFVDHVFNFSVGEGDKIWFRNFQIVDESLQLQEVGPRFVLEMVRLFAGSFEGAVLYDNPNYVSPNVIRREHRKGQHSYIEKQLAVKASNIKQAKVTEILAEKTVDLVGKEFDTQNNAAADSEAAAQITAQIEKRRVRKKKSQASKYTGSD